MSSSIPDRQQSMAGSAVKGFIWVFLTSGLGKCASLIAHLALGWFLLDQHWGIYSIALSIAVFLEVLRDGGTSHLVVSRGAEGYDQVAGPAFWIAALFNFGACLALVLISPMAASYYGHPDLEFLLIGAGLGYVLGTPTAILRAKLQVELRFEALAIVAAATSLTRALVLIVTAYSGAETWTFFWGFIAFAAGESVFYWLATLDSPWFRSPAFADWPGLFKSVRSLMLGNFLVKLSGRADYFVLSMLIGVGLLGQYMFAYELVFQLSELISVNFQTVLFPVLNRLAHNRERLQRAVERTIGTLVMAVAAPAFLFAILARPIEQLLWQGKWAKAVEAAEVFALSEPLRGLMVVAHCLLLAQARFEARIFLMFGICVSVAVGALAGGLIFEDDLRGIAATNVVIQVIFVFAASYIVFKGIGCNMRSVILSAVLPMVVGGLSAVAAIMADEAIATHLVFPGSRLVVTIVAFVLTFLFLSRFLLYQNLNFLAQVLPSAKVRRIYCLLFCLEDPRGAEDNPRSEAQA